MPQQPAKALLLTSTHCVHCAGLLKVLNALVEKGELADLSIINLEESPECAEEFDVRSVPWLKLNDYVLEGARSRAEIEKWLQIVGTEEGDRAYLEEILAQGQVNNAIKLIQNKPEAMHSVINLLKDVEVKINIKLGIGVIMEEFAADTMFTHYIPALVDMLAHDDERIRCDVCHYLSLTGNKDLIASIEPLLNDVSDEVKEVAAESIEELSNEP